MANRKKRIHKEIALLDQEKKYKIRFKKEKEKRKTGLRSVLAVFAQANHKHAFKGQKYRKMLQLLYREVSLLKDRKPAGHQLFFAVLTHPKITFDTLYCYLMFAKSCGQLNACRSLQSWKIPKSKKDPVVFRSLFCHLWVKYKIPDCVDQVIYNLVALGYEQVEEKIMYEVVRGKGIHQVERISIPMNSKMNFFFQNSPAGLSVPHAMWWARLRSMGLSPAVAQKIIHQLYIDLSINWKEWLDDFVFFIRKKEMISTKDFNRITDFYLCQKNDGKSITIKGIEETIDVPSLFPDFSFKGRSLSSVLRFVEKWEAYLQLARETGATKEFRTSKFDPIKITYSEGLIWIRQIKTLKGLVVEGNQMRHCVGTYASYCISGESSIWSMRRISPAGKMKKLLTIELNEQTGEISEVRGTSNRPPKARELEWIEQWKEKIALQS